MSVAKRQMILAKRKAKGLRPFPEMTLPPSERRKRAKRMAAMQVGFNYLTKRQIRRLPSKASTKHSARQERRQMRRYTRKQGTTVSEFLS